MMKVVVVTGGIGSGKTSVCRLLVEKYGIPVYEADRRAKELYAESPSMLDRMESVLEVSLRDDSGEFVPARLADVIFNDADALGMVEDMLFPVMKEDFASWAKGYETVAFESATILEKPQFDGFGDIVLLVDAPVPLRLARAMERDCVDEAEVISRMEAQPLMNFLSEGGRISRVDHVLMNDSSLEKLDRDLAEFMGKYGLTKML